jgi:hypothetical protein
MGIGEHGDCVLYSPHKHLPIPDGAVMVVRENGPSRLASQPSAMRILQETNCSLLDAYGCADHPESLWLIKRILQRLGMRAWRRSIVPFFMDDAPISPRLEHPKMSTLAKRLLFGLLDTIETVAHLRRQNKLLWDQVLTEGNRTPVGIIPIPGECTPYLGGFAFDNEVQAEEVFMQWQQAGLPVTTWPDLPPEVSVQKGRHYKALKLRNTRIYLPVHQTLDHNRIINCIGNLQYG